MCIFGPHHADGGRRIADEHGVGRRLRRVRSVAYDDDGVPGVPTREVSGGETVFVADVGLSNIVEEPTDLNQRCIVPVVIARCEVDRKVVQCGERWRGQFDLGDGRWCVGDGDFVAVGPRRPRFTVGHTNLRHPDFPFCR